ncbi:hypothetical protein [Streptomyces aurantiogriseus]|uniref:Glycoside hydrolase family 65 n=1 Tax=Streptomyces aurantiogriseus TaxID=66870 RepID=A0A918FKH1_9ACTN|nr:hypothetical protein [Streptomyces aurantiogriseus]GGR47564.1 hypothetical protein GCM10010251_75770 [Streptomyces aurantiogriseus]
MTLDRRQLVRRYNPVLTAPHPTDVLTVGNGDIAMTVDLSGLQTFPEFHELRPDPRRVVDDGEAGLPAHLPRPFDRDDHQIPLRTQSTWGWYRTRTERAFLAHEATTSYETPRGRVTYLDRKRLHRAGDPIPDEFAAGSWFAFNPRRMHLGRLALGATPDGPRLDDPHRLTDARTELDLWTGTVHATYRLDGVPVAVTTVAHPVIHRFAVRLRSPLLARGLGVAWCFDPQPDDLAPFELPLDEHVGWTQLSPGRWEAHRFVESSAYSVEIETTGHLSRYDGGGRALVTTDQPELDVVVTLRPKERAASPTPAYRPSSADADVTASDFASVQETSARWWENHWLGGAAVSFEGSADERAEELERRVVLSQYLTAVNGAGATPPAETGLTYNTWTGKFHLEMHWWHAAHFALWGRGELLERSLGWYHDALAAARATAKRQGYRGARWPKQTDNSARESPSHIGVFLIWQQPHVIHLLELLHEEGRSTEFLREHYPLVEATADFMADFVEERDGAFTLPPPLIPAQESYLADRLTNTDPTFELVYWSWALDVANAWRRRLGLPLRDDWERVARGMRRPLVLPDGTYAALATPPYLVRRDHPSMLMALGWLPDTGIVDPDVMGATLDAVWNHWDFHTSWGWDYPVMAMTAARLGDVGRALDALLFPSPKNQFLTNGHNPQMPGFLTLYLPANGGLLAAVAHIAAAVEGGAKPPEGWTIAAEGFGRQPGDRLIRTTWTARS